MQSTNPKVKSSANELMNVAAYTISMLIEAVIKMDPKLQTNIPDKSGQNLPPMSAMNVNNIPVIDNNCIILVM